MKISLSVATPGKWIGKIIPISQWPFVIGRDPGCHLRPASAAISLRHCALLIREQKAYVRDFNSTNGTYINSTESPRVSKVGLQNGDRVYLGKKGSVVLTYFAT